VVKMDIAGFMLYFEAGRDHASPHVMIPLLGRFKGKTGEQWHLLPIVWRSRSGIEAGSWASRLLTSLLERNRRHGFVFADKKGKQTKASTLEPRFYEQLNWVWMRYPDLFAPNLNIEDDYGIARSCRRGSSTEAANQGVPSGIIEMICRWRKVERAQGRAPNLGMREHYMEVTQALEAFLQYSRPLSHYASSYGCQWLTVAVCFVLFCWKRFGTKGDSCQVRTVTGEHELTRLLTWDRLY
jgi:hypothetical protein